MKPTRFFTYAILVVIAAGGAIWYIINDYYSRQSKNSSVADVVMYKNPGCQCCDKWAAYMQANGYSVATVESQNLNQVKANYNIPYTMAACHTAIIDGYMVEGHVPVEDINRLLKERPKAIGLAVPGMPASSPGMNTALNEPFEVYLLGTDGSSEVYAQH